MSKSIIEDGIGRIAREVSSIGTGMTPTSGTPAGGFWIGVVMDDIDDQNMGRVWVYLPGFSARRADPDNIPSARATPTRNASGDYDHRRRSGWLRVYPLFPFFGSDGFRESQTGDSRSPRSGESNSYGMFYQPRIGDYVGVLFAQGNPNAGYWIGCVPKHIENFMVPGMAQTPISTDSSAPQLPGIERDESDPKGQRKPARVFATNLLKAGLERDVLRGASDSTIRRESPSRLGFGIKTVGDPDTGMLGHQFVMDDLPERQGVRIRTSKGAQIYLNDSAEFIYINTPKGNVWVSLEDSGRVNVFANDSISLHTMNDFNLVVENNMNVEVRGKLNVSVGDTTKFDFQKACDIRVGANGNAALTVQALGAISLKSGTEFKVGSGASFNVTATNHLLMLAGGETALTSSGDTRIEGANVWIASGAGASPAAAATATTPVAYKGIPGPPGGAGDGTEQYTAPIVPQHEPWSLHPQGGTLATNGRVREATKPPVEVRRGTYRPGSTAPAPVRGRPTPADSPGRYTGQPFSTTSQAERPQYSFAGADPELAAADTFTTLNDRVVKFIKEQNPFNPISTTVDGRNLIGYGTELTAASKSFLESIGAQADPLTGAFTVTEDQGEQMVRRELASQMKLLQRSVTEPVTPDQFDSLLSLAHNIGPTNFTNSGVLKAINEGRISDVPNEFMKWTTVGGQAHQGLITRRQQELDLFSSQNPMGGVN